MLIQILISLPWVTNGVSTTNANTRKTDVEQACVLGDTCVGKTSLLNQIYTNTFNQYQESSIGASNPSKLVYYARNNVIAKFYIWDTAGQERYRSLAPLYAKGATVIIVVYDITYRASFDNVSKWIDCIPVQQKCHAAIVVVVGNRLDKSTPRESNCQKARQRFLQKDSVSSNCN